MVYLIISIVDDLKIYYIFEVKVINDRIHPSFILKDFIITKVQLSLVIEQDVKTYVELIEKIVRVMRIDHCIVEILRG